MRCRECGAELEYLIRRRKLLKRLLAATVLAGLFTLFWSSLGEATILMWLEIFTFVMIFLWIAVAYFVVTLLSTSPSSFFEEEALCRPCVMKREEQERIAREEMHEARAKEHRLTEQMEVRAQAKNLERARRFEDAAQLYESVELWDDAGKARSKATSQTVKHISVNVNDLVDKLRTGGLAIPYKCTNCGAALTMDKNSKADGLKFCPYCGSSIDTESLAKLIDDALS